MEILEELKNLSDSEYKKFHSRLMPTVPKNKVLGVRVPKLRKLANEICSTDIIDEFLKELPHKYYEENNLHALLIAKEKDFSVLINKLNEFLPFVDNWATCDLLNSKIFINHKNELLKNIKIWLKSSYTYEVRFGIKMLMTYFLGESLTPEIFPLVINIKSDEYYINMMRAWFFATALCKNKREATAVLLEKRLDKWTHNKAIQKAVESYRIEKEDKDFLKTLKY